MKKVCFLFIAMMFLSTHAMGEEPDQWFYDAIKQDNPNQLAYYLYVANDCPFTEETLNEIVEGVFIRSRIKPRSVGWTSAPVYLDLAVQCLPLKNNNSIYMIHAKFGRVRPDPHISFDYPYELFGINDSAGIQQSFKGAVEEVITWYIKAHFNF